MRRRMPTMRPQAARGCRPMLLKASSSRRTRSGPTASPASGQVRGGSASRCPLCVAACRRGSRRKARTSESEWTTPSHVAADLFAASRSDHDPRAGHDPPRWQGRGVARVAGPASPASDRTLAPRFFALYLYQEPLCTRSRSAPGAAGGVNGHPDPAGLGPPGLPALCPAGPRAPTNANPKGRARRDSCASAPRTTRYPA